MVSLNWPPEEDHGLWMRILLQHDPEEGGAGWEHQFVGADNVAIADLEHRLSSVYLMLQVNVYVRAHEWLLHFLTQIIKYRAYLKYLQMLVLDSEWSGERDVWLFVCKTLAIYNKSGAYLGAIKWDFINNAKRGRALCIGYVWMFGKWIIYFFSRAKFPFNHAIPVFKAFLFI